MISSYKTWIQTHSGKRLDLLNPDPNNILITDIAHHLAGINRFTGASRYSVAEHSVRVSWEVERRARAQGMRAKVVSELAQWGLMHDASEYALGDVSRPLKKLPFMEGYRALEEHWQRILSEKFGLVGKEPLLVKEVDADILGTEAHHVMYPVHADWHKSVPGGLPRPWKLEEYDRLGWDAPSAERAFLSRFERLWDLP